METLVGHHRVQLAARYEALDHLLISLQTGSDLPDWAAAVARDELLDWHRRRECPTSAVLAYHHGDAGPSDPRPDTVFGNLCFPHSMGWWSTSEPRSPARHRPVTVRSVPGRRGRRRLLRPRGERCTAARGPRRVSGATRGAHERGRPGLHHTHGSGLQIPHSTVSRIRSFGRVWMAATGVRRTPTLLGMAGQSARSLACRPPGRATRTPGRSAESGTCSSLGDGSTAMRRRSGCPVPLNLDRLPLKFDRREVAADE